MKNVIRIFHPTNHPTETIEYYENDIILLVLKTH